MTTLILTDFTLLGNPLTANYTLTGGTTPSDDDYIIVVQLDIEDVNNIKRDLNLAVSEGSTLVSLTPTAILDMNRNQLNFTQPLEVSVYTNDTISPILVDFNLDLNANILTLIFNETVLVNSVVLNEITIQAAFVINESDPSMYRVLEAGLVSKRDDPIVTVLLNANDTNYIKRFVNLATSDTNTFISFSNLTLTDTNSNPVIAISLDNALSVTNFTRDTTSPLLVSHELDLTSEEIRFLFDETVNINSFDATALSFVGIDNVTSYTLTGGLIESDVNDTTFALVLTTFDLNELKKIETLATSLDNSYIQYNGELL